jgi:hypothetical protein
VRARDQRRVPGKPGWRALSVRAMREPALAGALCSGLDLLVAWRACPRTAGQCRITRRPSRGRGVAAGGQESALSQGVSWHRAGRASRCSEDADPDAGRRDAGRAARTPRRPHPVVSSRCSWPIRSAAWIPAWQRQISRYGRLTSSSGSRPHPSRRLGARSAGQSPTAVRPAPAKPLSRSSSNTTSSSRPMTSAVRKGRSPATRPPRCATRWPPSAPASPAVPREPHISLLKRLRRSSSLTEDAPERIRIAKRQVARITERHLGTVDSRRRIEYARLMARAGDIVAGTQVIRIWAWPASRRPLQSSRLGTRVPAGHDPRNPCPACAAPVGGYLDGRKVSQGWRRCSAGRCSIRVSEEGTNTLSWPSCHRTR